MHDSLISGERGDLTHTAAGQLAVRLTEEYLIADIKDFPTELRAEAFADRKILH